MTDSFDQAAALVHAVTKHQKYHVKVRGTASAALLSVVSLKPSKPWVRRTRSLSR
ncbi:uncharacterized protein (UPF0548 family) [Herbaspirillum sp. Sphag1AN]|uniref:hypothetical protein n=1 Tax=unclassified Herbaspirillum TaxID=2624150 RepID=UPI00181F4C83|nr:MULTISPECIES: hypothetical protein [unclassified Herbaspirillum]MBB3213643.1 uncharacterized protein (UPF0548 family) [Herbaspirillum sp. Sphag1AN]MBB3246841.1 uncharacterized protein (UPF0548 family) [Herbaspirillum sp. Sphag64]